MYELNTLAVRYYLENPERAALHEIAEQKHRARTGSFGDLIADLMRVVASALSPIAPQPPHRPEPEEKY